MRQLSNPVLAGVLKAVPDRLKILAEQNQLDQDCPLTVIVSPVTAFRLWPGVLDAEGVGDPLVRGLSLLVDAVGVDLQQGRDSLPRYGGPSHVPTGRGSTSRQGWSCR